MNEFLSVLMFSQDRLFSTEGLPEAIGASAMSLISHEEGQVLVVEPLDVQDTLGMAEVDDSQFTQTVLELAL